MFIFSFSQPNIISQIIFSIAGLYFLYMSYMFWKNKNGVTFLLSARVKPKVLILFKKIKQADYKNYKKIFSKIQIVTYPKTLFYSMIFLILGIVLLLIPYIEIVDLR